jgi:hypothetical protein
MNCAIVFCRAGKPQEVATRPNTRPVGCKYSIMSLRTSIAGTASA